MQKTKMQKDACRKHEKLTYRMLLGKIGQGVVSMLNTLLSFLV